MKENASAHKARLLIVDDHPIVRYGMTRILSKENDLMVCGEAQDGNEALQAIQKLKPDLVLVDISLKRVDGLKLTKIIRTDFPETPVLIVSMHDETVYARKALRSGAKGYIMKEESSEKLVTAVRQVLRGEIYLSDNVKNHVLTDFVTPNSPVSGSPIEKLSDRERQIFIMLGQGYTSRDIADRLLLSIKTVETHRSRIKLKLGISGNPHLLLSAAEWVDREGLKPSMAP